MTQSKFFQDLFGEKPSGGLFIQVWTKGDKQNHYFDSATAAGQFAAAHPRDVYTGVSLSPKNFGPRRRCGAAQSAGIAGVWADIDVAGGPLGNDEGKAPDFAAAEQLAFSILEPTLCVNSGYGLQAWWLFDDGPWFFGDGRAERERGAAVAAGWIALLREKAQTLGFDLDAVQDLARLMRVPGTLNCKGGKEAPVGHVYEPSLGPRHSRETITKLALDAKPAATTVREVLEGLVGEFEIDPRAQPPYDRMQVAGANNPLFIKTLEHTRRERSIENWSLSEYDLSLASMAVQMGWSDQEIVDLLIFHRKKHGEPEKALREDYLRKTLGRARRQGEATKAEKRVDDALQNLAAMGKQAESDPDAVMEAFNDVIGSDKLKVMELIQDGDDPRQARYRIIVEPGAVEVPIGAPSTLFNPDAFREAFGVVTGHVMPLVKKAAWLEALQALLNVRQVHIADDDTIRGQVVEWMGKYVGERMLPDPAEAIRRREPFERDGSIFVFAASFHTFVTRSVGRRVSEADLKMMLKQSGFAPKPVSFRTESGSSTSRSYYCAPKGVLD